MQVCFKDRQVFIYLFIFFLSAMLGKYHQILPAWNKTVQNVTKYKKKVFCTKMCLRYYHGYTQKNTTYDIWLSTSHSLSQEMHCITNKMINSLTSPVFTLDHICQSNSRSPGQMRPACDFHPAQIKMAILAKSALEKMATTLPFL